MTSPSDPIRNAALEELRGIAENLGTWTNISLRTKLQEIAAALSAGEPVAWHNNCDKTAVHALRYLANNPRPRGGQDRFNTEHLIQIALEIELMAARKLYAAPQPVACPATPWDANHNRSHPPVEKRAREIYDKLLGAEDYPWVEGGNSVIQDKCRDQARDELRAAAPSFEKNSEAQG